MNRPLTTYQEFRVIYSWLGTVFVFVLVMGCAVVGWAMYNGEAGHLLETRVHSMSTLLGGIAAVAVAALPVTVLRWAQAYVTKLAGARRA